MIRCPTCNRPKDTCPGRACFDARERARSEPKPLPFLDADDAAGCGACGSTLVCLHCAKPTRKVPWSPYVEGFDKGLDEGEWRALLERDVADVRHSLDDEDRDRRLSQWEADMCEAWLTRARAALS